MTNEAKPDTTLPFPYWTEGINDPKDSSRLVKRVKLSDLMNYDPRASYKHKRLWEFHLGWAHKDYSWTSLASVRHIRDQIQKRSPSGKTMSTRSIVEATKDLLDWSYLIEAEKGRGHRGSRYHINWDLLDLAANGEFPVEYPLQVNAISVLPMVTQGVSLEEHAKPVSVHPEGNKDPTTMTRLEDGANSSSNSAAPASPPLAAGLAPASGEAPQGRASDTVQVTQAGFDGLWNTYSFKQDRAKAKAAYAKLDPAAELHAVLITEASRWHAHYEEHGVEPRWRVRLHNWLAGECWLQDPPLSHSDAKSAAISKVRGSAKPAATQKARKPASPTTVRIVAAEVVSPRFGISDLRFTTDDGAEHVIVLESDNADAQFAGQKELAQLVRAVGLTQIEDDKELLGRSVVLIGGEERFAAPDMRPDDEPPLPVRVEDGPAPPPPTETPRAFAARAARQFNDPWPDWMEAEAPSPRRQKPPKAKMQRKEISYEEEQRRLREWIADGLFDDDDAAA